MTEQTPESADLLYGVPAIAKHMNIRPLQVHHRIEKGGLPIFRMGVVICDGLTMLRAGFTEREASACSRPSGR